MLTSVYLLLLLIAMLLTIIHAINARIPLWIPLLLVIVALLASRAT